MRSIDAGTSGALPTMYGGWLPVYFGISEHAGLADNVLDHRLDTRTIYMNPIFGFVYWNIEHHMFPMCPIIAYRNCTKR